MKEIKLIPYTELEIGDYIDEVVKRFSVSLKKTGVENSDIIAEDKVIGEFFPDKKLNDKQFVFHIQDAETKVFVGWLWLADRGNKELRIADIHIAEPYRQLGYGKTAMNMVHEFAIDKGFSIMSLNVFDENINAKKMYLQLGYEVVENKNGRIEMRKLLAFT